MFALFLLYITGSKLWVLLENAFEELATHIVEHSLIDRIVVGECDGFVLLLFALVDLLRVFQFLLCFKSQQQSYFFHF